MSEWKVTVKALVSVDDPDTLSKLVLCRMKTDEAGEEVVSAMDDDFSVVEYPDGWLDFTEVMKTDKDVCPMCNNEIVDHNTCHLK
jgi:hypothetical protein|tara:strand:+ start:191 stop:445 length:255 start_codon:yes stop_codon:yes gene_type:complete